MKKFKIKRMPTQQNLYLKSRIAKNRTRTKWVGLTYFIAAVAMAVMACFPLLHSDVAYFGIAHFWRGFVGFDINVLNNTNDVLPFTVSFLYVITMIVIAINLVKGTLKFRGLFRKKASAKYGFNLNAVQMHGMGGVFSNIFAATITFYFLAAVLCGGLKGTPLLIIVVAVGLVVHFLCGLRGGKASYFDVDEYGKMIEHKREIGRVAPFFRNLSQVLTTFIMIYFFLRTCGLHAVIPPFFQEDTWTVYLRENPLTFASMGLQILTALSLIALLKHATGISEYDIEGTQAAGMKNFRVFAFFVMLTSFATFVCRLLFGEARFTALEGGGTVFETVQWRDYTSLIVAGIALGMFILEVAMRNMPAAPQKEEAEEGFYEMRDVKEEGDDFYDDEPSVALREEESDGIFSAEASECGKTEEN